MTAFRRAPRLGLYVYEDRLLDPPHVGSPPPRPCSERSRWPSRGGPEVPFRHNTPWRIQSTQGRTERGFLDMRAMRKLHLRDRDGSGEEFCTTL